MKRLYTEGSVFLVPLREGGFARGVVARAPKRAGKVLLGYFFAPKLLSIGDATLNDIEPSKSNLCVRFGDLGLINGTWPILGILPDWQRANWPIPDFIRRELLTERAFLVRYSDADPRKIEFETPIDPATELPQAGMCGSGYVEIRLTRLLTRKAD